MNAVKALYLIIRQADSVDIPIHNVLFNDILLIIIAGIHPIQICSIGVINTVKICHGSLLMDHIVRLGLFHFSLGEGHGGIGPVTGEYISAGIVQIPGCIKLVSQRLQLLDNNGKLAGGIILVSAFIRLPIHISKDIGYCGQPLAGYLNPALGIRCIFLIILGQFGNTAPEAECTDRHNRIIRRSCNRLLGRHLCA